MSKSNRGRISADWGATSALLTIKHNAKHIFPYYKMGRKIPVFVRGGVPKNNTDTSHGISVFSYGEYPTEFFLYRLFGPPNQLHFSLQFSQKIFFFNFHQKIFFLKNNILVQLLHGKRFILKKIFFFSNSTVVVKSKFLE
jgi:hypothetical protein